MYPFLYLPNLQVCHSIAITKKDQQRMMVDPMLMIAQSLRSFLTAFTTTAVAQIALIFTYICLNIPKNT